MTPLEEGVCHPIGEAHGSLHHLDRPGHFDTRADPSAPQLEARLTLEITVYSRLNPAWWLAPGEFDLHAHPIGEGRRNHTVQDRSFL
jgi:hypothetical protein